MDGLILFSDSIPYFPPLPFLPDFPVPYITHVDIVEAGLESLESEVLSVATTIESARFMNNKIGHIQDDAFRWVLGSMTLGESNLNEKWLLIFEREQTVSPFRLAKIWEIRSGWQIVYMQQHFIIRARPGAVIEKSETAIWQG